jgi:hypothetical protein
VPTNDTCSGLELISILLGDDDEVGVCDARIERCAKVWPAANGEGVQAHHKDFLDTKVLVQ